MFYHLSHNMSSQIVLGLSLFIPLLLFLGSCGICSSSNVLEQEQFQPAVEEHKDVCTTAECMQIHFNTCDPATLDIQQDGGRNSDGDCIVYVKVNSVDKSQIPEGMEFLAGTIEGSDMACAFNDEDMNKLMSMSSGSSEEFDPSMLDKCDGPLKTFIQMAMSNQ